MTRHALLAAAALLAALYVPAPAAAAAPRVREGPARAEVAWSYRPRSRVAADQILWWCAGTRCAARLYDTPSTALRACTRLARAVGEVVRFETPSGAFTDEQIERCNGRR
jgi:hypothetical protein